MVITNDLRYRFCKNYGIPINLYIEPYFMNRIKLLDKEYGTFEKYYKFIATINKFRTQQEYYEVYNKVKDTILEDIKSSEYYQQFIDFDMSEIRQRIREWNFPTKSIYSPEFDGKRFISVDMRQANFAALYDFDSRIFSGAKSWEEYVSRFTDDESIIKGKYIRQVILGNCNPKRQITYQKNIMGGMFWKLSIPQENMIALLNDEIIIANDDNEYLEHIQEVADAYTRLTNFEMKVESFTLRDIGEKLGYVKIYDNGNFKLKCVDSDYLPMLLRYIQCGEISKEDLYFSHKGSVAKFVGIPKQILNSNIVNLATTNLKRTNVILNSNLETFNKKLNKQED